MPLDVDRLAEAMLAGTQALIAKALAPLIEANAGLTARNADLERRIAAVEAREFPPSAAPADVEALWAGLTAAVDAIEALEEPDVAGMVQEAVSAAVAGLEAPATPDVAPMVFEAVRAAVVALPSPPAARDFTPEIEALRRDVAAIVIPEPVPGRDGAGVAEAKQNDDGELIFKLTTGETFNVGKVRGADGLGFEDMRTEWDGERMLTLAFTRDARTEATSITIPAIIDRGVWREGRFQRGDAVTWGGSLWIAQCDTGEKPEAGADWRLAVKRGRDGKDYRPPEEKGPIRVGVPT